MGLADESAGSTVLKKDNYFRDERRRRRPMTHDPDGADVPEETCSRSRCCDVINVTLSKGEEG